MSYGIPIDAEDREERKRRLRENPPWGKGEAPEQLAGRVMPIFPEPPGAPGEPKLHREPPRKPPGLPEAPELPRMPGESREGRHGVRPAPQPGQPTQPRTDEIRRGDMRPIEVPGERQLQPAEPPSGGLGSYPYEEPGEQFGGQQRPWMPGDETYPIPPRYTIPSQPGETSPTRRTQPAPPTGTQGQPGAGTQPGTVPNQFEVPPPAVPPYVGQEDIEGITPPAWQEPESELAQEPQFSGFTGGDYEELESMLYEDIMQPARRELAHRGLGESTAMAHAATRAGTRAAQERYRLQAKEQARRTAWEQDEALRRWRAAETSHRQRLTAWERGQRARERAAQNRRNWLQNTWAMPRNEYWKQIGTMMDAILAPYEGAAYREYGPQLMGM